MNYGSSVDRVEWLWDQLSVPLLPSGLVNFLPNLAITLVVGVLIGGWAAPRLGLRQRVTGALWLTALLLPLAYTLSSARSGNPTGCDVGLVPWQSRSALMALETRANIAMLMPAGAAALLFPSGPRRLAALGAALAMPMLIELTQLVVEPLRRACQGIDVLNNTLGVLLGFWLAAGAWVLWASMDRTRKLSTPLPNASLPPSTGDGRSTPSPDAVGHNPPTTPSNTSLRDSNNRPPPPPDGLPYSSRVRG